MLTADDVKAMPEWQVIRNHILNTMQDCSRSVCQCTRLRDQGDAAVTVGGPERLPFYTRCLVRGWQRSGANRSGNLTRRA